MIKQDMMARYLESLLRGDRRACRAVIEEALQSGIPANSVYVHIVWPVMLEIEKLLRKDKITPVQEHLATRVNRTIVDQLQNKLPRRPRRNKKMVVCCAAEELQELGAQIIADLFESDGWEVRFLGGGLTNDDILAFINEYGPAILSIHGTVPKQAPDVRRLIDTIKSVNAWPDMRIMVSGGLFDRAEGLWQEMEADLYAPTPLDALEMASSETPAPQGEQRTINRRRRRKQVAQEKVPVPV
ncbi:MAG: cobalamin-dependent protein [Planctomycetota bacterium]|nr:cobalamin-dependent protein [Planctomycetota bacterium]